jgi:hypothetical protein
MKFNENMWQLIDHEIDAWVEIIGLKRNYQMSE